jgi:hypothetical protein
MASFKNHSVGAGASQICSGYQTIVPTSNNDGIVAICHETTSKSWMGAFRSCSPFWLSLK